MSKQQNLKLALDQIYYFLQYRLLSSNLDHRLKFRFEDLGFTRVLVVLVEREIELVEGHATVRLFPEHSQHS